VSPEPGQEPKASRYTVQSVARALDILELIAKSRDGLTLTEIARAIGTSKSATYSLLRTMVDREHVREVAAGPRYQLGVGLVKLADIALTQISLGELAKPVLTELSDELGMTTRIAIVDDGQPIFIDRVDGPGTVRFHTPMGKRELAHASAAGKAILACLPEARVREICADNGMARRTSHTLTSPEELLADLESARSRGFAVDDEEDADGVFCVGAAFFDHRGDCAGAISATFIKLDVSADRIAEVGSATRLRADQVSALLGGPPYAERNTR
jgi:IclR family acetate operon transcriptional repressor